MANSKYDILETRVVIDGSLTHLYIRISNANDFVPIAGWYKRTIGIEHGPANDVLNEALANQDYLVFKNGWSRGGPDDPKNDLSYVPQEVAHDLVQFLTEAGYGKPGSPNTIWAMTKQICEDRTKTIDDIIALIKERWTFDNNQVHTHTWHDMADVLKELADMKGTS